MSTKLFNLLSPWPGCCGLGRTGSLASLASLIGPQQSAAGESPAPAPAESVGGCAQGTPTLGSEPWLAVLGWPPKGTFSPLLESLRGISNKETRKR